MKNNLSEKNNIQQLRNKIDALTETVSKLKKSDQLISNAVNNAPIGMVTLAINGKFKTVNKTFCQIVGYTKKELLTLNFNEITHPDDKNIGNSVIDDLTSGKANSAHIEKRYIHKNGTIIHAQVSTVILKDELGNPQTFFTQVLDNTNSKLMLELLLNSESRFKKLSETAFDAIIMMNNKGLVAYWNKAAERIYGYTSKEAMGQEIHRLIAPAKYYERYQQGFGSFVKSGKGKAVGAVLELIGLKKDKTEFPIEISLSAFKLNKEWHATAIIKDITDRKLAQSQLAESEKRYKKLFNSSKDALMTLNPPTWKFTSGNPAILDMFKVKSIEEYLKCGPWDISPEKQPDGRQSSEKAKEMIGTAMEKGSNYFEWTHKRMNGESFPATVLLTKIKLNDETFLQATVRDITDSKKAKEKLIRRNRELEIWANVTTGRELKLVELKKEINELLEKSGKKPKYIIPV